MKLRGLKEQWRWPVFTSRQYTAGIAIGVLLTAGIVLSLEHRAALLNTAQPAEKPAPHIINFSAVESDCRAVCLGYSGSSEQALLEVEAKIRADQRREYLRKQAAMYTKVSDIARLVKSGVNPNTIRIALAEAPLPRSGKRVEGKMVCNKKHDKPRMSRKYDEVHIDRQCCLDPDEVPNPRCTYK